MEEACVCTVGGHRTHIAPRLRAVQGAEAVGVAVASCIKRLGHRNYGRVERFSGECLDDHEVGLGSVQEAVMTGESASVIIDFTSLGKPLLIMLTTSWALATMSLVK